MVFVCECCQYSTPFKYTLKQHMSTKRHLLKMENALKEKETNETNEKETDVKVNDHEIQDLRRKVQEQESLIEVQQQMLDGQTNQLEQLLRKLEVFSSMHTGHTNTTSTNVQNIHILLHPDMNLSQLTKYEYQVILKKIQDRDYEKLTDGMLNFWTVKIELNVKSEY